MDKVSLSTYNVVMGTKKEVVRGIEHESMLEKILEGLALSYTERHELALSLSLHVLQALETQGIEPFEEKDIIPRTRQILKMKKKNDSETGKTSQ
jgi:hypothetical protein